MIEFIKIIIGILICALIFMYGLYIAKHDTWHKDNDFKNPKYNKK